MGPGNQRAQATPIVGFPGDKKIIWMENTTMKRKMHAGNKIASG